MAEEKEDGRKRRTSGRRTGARSLANGSVKNGRGAAKPAPKPHAKAVSRAANKRRPPSGIIDAAKGVVRERPALSVIAAFAAGILVGFRSGRR